jgi:hypothetical protein
MQPAFMGRIEFFRDHDHTIESVLEDDRSRFSRSFPNGLKFVPGGMKVAEDQDLVMRSCTKARSANVPEILLGYREAKLSIARMATAMMKSIVFNCNGMRARWMYYGFVQCLKLLVDCFAIISLLEYRILRHRAYPSHGLRLCEMDFGLERNQRDGARPREQLECTSAISPRDARIYWPCGPREQSACREFIACFEQQYSSRKGVIREGRYSVTLSSQPGRSILRTRWAAGLRCHHGSRCPSLAGHLYPELVPR